MWQSVEMTGAQTCTALCLPMIRSHFSASTPQSRKTDTVDGMLSLLHTFKTEEFSENVCQRVGINARTVGQTDNRNLVLTSSNQCLLKVEKKRWQDGFSTKKASFDTLQIYNKT
jgi:hypothetical protein